LRPGDLCRIYRPSKTAIKAEFYRICFNKWYYKWNNSMDEIILWMK
jgi:hypothetical protein